jgi:Helix-turn-helix domain
MGEPDEKFLTAEEVAPILRITPGTLKKWSNRKKGPPSVLVGRRRLYPEAAFHLYLKGLAVNAGDPGGDA